MYLIKMISDLISNLADREQTTWRGREREREKDRKGINNKKMDHQTYDQTDPTADIQESPITDPNNII